MASTVVLNDIEEIQELGRERARAGIWAYPTDTVWGLGAWPGNDKAHAALTTLKGHSDDKPLSVLFGDLASWEKSAAWPAHIRGEWARKFFSLGTSLAGPKEWFHQEWPAYVAGTGPYLSTRCLELPFLRTITELLDGPLTTTSLNLTGYPPVEDIQAARTFLAGRPGPGAEIFLWAGGGVNPTGQASSMLCLKADQTWEWWRKGGRAQDVQRHLAILSA